MIEKIKEIFRTTNDNYKPYNMIICANELHKKICHCSCHTTPNMVHIRSCCFKKTCPDCKKELNVRA